VSLDVKRKRPWWFGWIPAVILVVIIGGIITATTLLARAGLGDPVPRPTEGQVTDLNWSSFTEEGLAYIDASRQVRIDLSRGPALAADLGLEDDGSLTIGPKDNGDVVLDYSLIINGGGEGPGGDKFIVGQLTIETTDGAISAIRAPLSEVVNFRQTLDKLIGKAELFGWDTSHVQQIYDMVDDATKAGEPYSFTFGPADKVGVPVAATASCDPTGYCLVEYDVTPPVR
jgi:hypothetical protein